MFHGVKRFVGTHKTSNKVHDDEFADLVRDMKVIQKQLLQMVKAFEENQKIWDNLKRNCKIAVDASAAASEEGWVEDLTRTATMDCDWQKDAPGKADAVKFLQDYNSFLKKIDADIKRREDLSKDVDYYRGKVEDLQKKAKDQDKLYKAEDELASKETEYDRINDETKEKLRYSLSLKDAAFGKCLMSYFQIQASLMSGCPYFDYIETHGHVLDEPFPDVYSFSSQLAAPSPRTSTSSRRPPSVSGRSQPNQIRVRALYDFDAESEQEITFKTGDVINGVVEIDANWLEGTFRGQKGMFPSNYVEYL